MGPPNLFLSIYLAFNRKFKLMVLPHSTGKYVTAEILGSSIIVFNVLPLHQSPRACEPAQTGHVLIVLLQREKSLVAARPGVQQKSCPADQLANC